MRPWRTDQRQQPLRKGLNISAVQPALGGCVLRTSATLTVCVLSTRTAVSRASVLGTTTVWRPLVASFNLVIATDRWRRRNIMAVVKSKRKTGKLAVITKANELAVYTIKISSNE